MRCKEIHGILEQEREWTAAVRDHLASCPACAGLACDWRRVRAGLALLRREEPPEPSWGFAERLMRRLESLPQQGQRGQEFLEQVGRRMVYATLFIALVTLLGLVLPSSGPLRSPSNVAVLFAQPEVTAANQEPILGVGSVDSVQSEGINPTRVEGNQRQP